MSRYLVAVSRVSLWKERLQNIEFKAELRDLPLARTIARRLGADIITTMWQIDTYYRLADGRLKRREIETDGEPTRVEYIFYHREDAAKVRSSQFTIYSEQEAAVRFGSLALPVWVVVKKQRELLMHNWTRIHLDMVDRLGMFIEIESLVSAQNPEPACFDAVRKLREALGPVIGEPISVSYSDLLAAEPEQVGGAGPMG